MVFACSVSLESLGRFSFLDAKSHDGGARWATIWGGGDDAQPNIPKQKAKQFRAPSLLTPRHRTTGRFCDSKRSAVTKKTPAVYLSGMNIIETPIQQEAPQPVQSKERVVLLDVIRGFALGGVFLSNVFLWFNGRFLLPQSFWKDYKPQGIEAAISWGFRNLIFGRFITIFSFLFGLGIAMQFFRAENRDDSAGWRYTRRALVMILFAIVHTTLIWYGDILHVYAIFGFSLLLFRRASTKTLVITGAILTFFAPPIAGWIEQFLPRLWTNPEVLKQQHEATMAAMATSNAELLTLLSSNSYMDVIRGNVLVYWRHFARINVIGFYIGLVGNFLLGFAAGRVDLFANVDKYRRLFRHLFGWGLLAGIVGNLAMMVLRDSGPGKKYFVTNETIVPLLMPVAREIPTLGMAALYIAAISLLFQRSWGQRFLSMYAPVGRMAVTNYLSESLICLFIFTGIGLGKIGAISPQWMVLMPFTVFSLQMIFSWLWLKKFAYGPVEWLWRTMTYGKKLPITKVANAEKIERVEVHGEAVAISSSTV